MKRISIALASAALLVGVWTSPAVASGDVCVDNQGFRISTGTSSDCLALGGGIAIAFGNSDALAQDGVAIALFRSDALSQGQGAAIAIAESDALSDDSGRAVAAFAAEALASRCLAV